MKEPEMEAIGSWIADVLDSINDEGLQKRVKKEVEALCERFPLYPGRL
jgi:glycine/serine hydroxymethyltransferase